MGSTYSKQSLLSPSVLGNYEVQEAASLAIKRDRAEKVQVGKQMQLACVSQVALLGGKHKGYTMSRNMDP